MIRDQFILDISDKLIIDNFAGGGGASCGIELALGRHVDHAINHDPEAVAMHAMPPRRPSITANLCGTSRRAILRFSSSAEAVEFGTETRGRAIQKPISNPTHIRANDAVGGRTPDVGGEANGACGLDDDRPRLRPMDADGGLEGGG
ncbi:hypothetical protein [Pandoraea apista]|uniref:hypothetical protein n=1 Tax=Pandoraea apista TaxID=93218 RepID=UPI00058A841C|nr:hypothetical protein SG18_21890 [Pandoraea apista]AKH74327.1 hypothetical protein XM39_22070 [Pandoraea apista]AKI62876.1 hypothetical protein AA956_15395 [Pandoraea apista]